MKWPRALLTEHRSRAEVVGAVVALAAGIGIGAAVWASGAGTTTDSVSASTSTPSTSTPAVSPRHHGVRGLISAESGSTWSVTTPAGQVVTVTLTPQTRFGTRAAPATEGQFVVGSPVTVVGQPAGGAITAQRVYTPLRPLGSGGTTTTLPPSGAAAGAATSSPVGPTPAPDAGPAAWPALTGPSQGGPSPVSGGARTVDLEGGEHGQSGPPPVRT